MNKVGLRELEYHPREEASPAPWRDRIGGGAVTLFFASYLLLSSVLSGVIVELSFGAAPEPESLSALQIAPFTGVGAVAALCSFWLSIKLPVCLTVASIGLVRPQRKWLLFGAGLGLLGWVLSGVVGSAYVWITGDASSPRPELEAAVGQDSAWQMALLLVATCLLAPVAEEIVFRGVLYTYLRRWGFVVALITSSLVFALFHGFGIMFFTVLAAGALFALAYERSGSLWPAIVAHGTTNATMFAAGWLLAP